MYYFVNVDDNKITKGVCILIWREYRAVNEQTLITHIWFLPMKYISDRAIPFDPLDAMSIFPTTNTRNFQMIFFFLITIYKYIMS